MNSQKLQDWLQVVGIFGVIASLIFVGLQMAQTQEIAISAAYQSRADTSIAVRTAPLESAELLSGLSKAFRNESEAISDEERTALQFYFWTNLIYLENMHYQYRNGFLTEEQWEANLSDIRFLLTVKPFRETWETQPGRWRRSFEEIVDSIASELDQT